MNASSAGVSLPGVMLLITNVACGVKGGLLINQYQFRSNQLKYLDVFLTIPDGLEMT